MQKFILYKKDGFSADDVEHIRSTSSVKILQESSPMTGSSLLVEGLSKKELQEKFSGIEVFDHIIYKLPTLT